MDYLSDDDDKELETRIQKLSEKPEGSIDNDGHNSRNAMQLPIKRGRGESYLKLRSHEHREKQRQF